MSKKKKKDDEGGDSWLTTFADMATLLMSFFVLILSFAELDVVKYKAIVGSMKQALGVEKKEMEFLKSPTEKKDSTKHSTPATTSGDKSVDAMRQEQVTTQARLIRQRLSELVQESLVTIEEKATNLVIRIPEKGVFPSGSARLDPKYKPVLFRIRDALGQADGDIIISGHTDNRPIHNPDYRSNWDLSAERAVSVLHVLLEGDVIDPERMTAQGFADTRPLVPNTDPESMQLNRRVEIVVERPRPRPEKPKYTIEETIKRPIKEPEVDDDNETPTEDSDDDAPTTEDSSAGSEDGEGADDENPPTPPEAPKVEEPETPKPAEPSDSENDSTEPESKPESDPKAPPTVAPADDDE